MENKNMRLRILALAVAGTLALSAAGQGVVVYSLPSTTLHLSVEADRCTYVPGPYAQYAKKYLGIDVAQEPSTSYTLRSIRMTPYLEADRGGSYVLNLEGLEKDIAAASFLEFSSQGLLMLSDTDRGRGDKWRFPSMAPGLTAASEATGNLTSTETVLYRSVRNEDGGFEQIAVRQSQVVEKSLEKKAQEAASMILSLRQNRINIVTGNTDATFSGDALRAAVEEITRTEDRLMALFTGTTSTSVQTKTFDVIPENSPEDELTIAFRISDTQGLLPADDISGRPVVMEITPEATADTLETEQVIADLESRKRRMKYEAAGRGDIFYRVPAVCRIRLTDGQDLLLQSRIPVYQKGRDLTFPVSVLVR